MNIYSLSFFILDCLPFYQKFAVGCFAGKEKVNFEVINSYKFLINTKHSILNVSILTL